MSYKRITKDKARKIYKDVPVFVSANKLDVENVWQPPVAIPRDREFNKYINEYAYYNCCYSENGYHVAFYVEVE